MSDEGPGITSRKEWRGRGDGEGGMDGEGGGMERGMDEGRRAYAV